jgi:rare lipoprotein A
LYRVPSHIVISLCFCVFFGLSAGMVSGCSSSLNVIGKKKPKYSPRIVKLGQRVPKGGGRYKVGNPYQVAGVWYTPKEDRYYDKRGIASWYGEEFHGRLTANGEVFDMNALTAAHPTMPIPSYAEVTNIRNGRTILVRVNDRGPYKHDRLIDLSKKVSQVLDFNRNGTTPVRVRYVGRAPINGDDRREQDFLARQPWHRRAFSYEQNYQPEPRRRNVNYERRW